MKIKFITLFLCLCLIASAFVGCSKQKTPSAEGLEQNADVYGIETDAEGNTVAVIYENGKAYIIDEEGNKTNKKIKNPQNAPKDDKKNDKDKENSGSSSDDQQMSPERIPDREEEPSNNTDDSDGTTNSELTTLPLKSDKVPSTSETGKEVQFSDADIKTLTNMLEVPYLYSASYENTDKVPIEVATHVACWMASRENLNTNTFAGGTIVIDLFNYFARTVQQFKTDCNAYTDSGVENAAPIKYNSVNDTFVITENSYEERTHRINITRIEYLGNNNYYKVVADVSAENKSCKAKSVIAIVQKNKLDTSLNFSVKALKWS